MQSISWTRQINFTSALLLHSCITIILKETCNILEISRRRLFHFWKVHRQRRSCRGRIHSLPCEISTEIQMSVVLDAYTSIFSYDLEGELAELYFTNTGFILLLVSLSFSVLMNLFLTDSLLNAFVAITFSFAFLASLINGEKEIILPILSLRRAGRFIWSDTPFVNFFSLIYVATVLKARSELRLVDYVTLRCIAVTELVFMKVRLASQKPEKQVELMRQLVNSEWIAAGCTSQVDYIDRPFAMPHRNNMIPFTTLQRLSVMLFKTCIGHHFGSLQGSLGPATCPVPDVGCYINEPMHGWRIYRLSEDVMFIQDCLAEFSTHNPTCLWGRCIVFTHGILLRQLGKVRVIYLLKKKGPGTTSIWHSNVNLVTGVTRGWLDGNFRPVLTSAEKGVIS